MHFEILVEDISGKIILETLVPQILASCHEEHTFKIIPYKGIGRLPKGLSVKANPQKRQLLSNLPEILKGYGKSFRNYHAAVLVVVDLDKNDCIKFKEELLAVLKRCNPAPKTLFRIAIEEMESWLLGDKPAIKKAFPHANESRLRGYKQDSICDTWEYLADVIYPGGAKELKKHGYPVVGKTKCDWATKIAPHMDVENNKSKSFQVLREGFRKLSE